MNAEQAKELENFKNEHKVRTKGKLSVALYLTREAKRRNFPLAPSDFLAESRGQVRGLSKAAVQAILRDHGINRTLAQEAGRTSRGSVGLMEAYVQLLNRLNESGMLDMEAAEQWWVDRVRDYFASMPLKMKYDASKSLQSLFEDLFRQVREREESDPGATYLGTVLQHLVGAKIELSLPNVQLDHFGASVADHSTGRMGDFQIESAVIHVTTMPSEALIEKCRGNLRANLSPIIITMSERAPVARGLADIAGIVDRIDILAA